MYSGAVRSFPLEYKEYIYINIYIYIHVYSELPSEDDAPPLMPFIYTQKYVIHLKKKVSGIGTVISKDDRSPLI